MPIKSFFRPLRRRLAIALLFLIAVIYLNRAYAHIYNHIDNMGLKEVNSQKTMEIANNEAASSTLVYVALGDSLSAGVGASSYEESFPYILGSYLAGNDYRLTLENLAVPGARTEYLASTLVPEALAADPDIVTLLIGINDIHGQVGLKQFRENYDSILNRLTNESKAQIYVINLPYIGAPNLLLPPYRAFFDLEARRYNKAIEELCLRYGVPYLDLYSKTEGLFKENGPHYSPYFFHPSAEGYRIWADLIYADISN